ncbi:hypothetical protein BBO99_00001252 [Phytophthora kernoviae]|uniref:CS domain-containing protein n=1 Tax=Phytophthora kernoviae TaxID=325452 RepID=A0A421H0N2_9STRA|nr:hypothetical protein BBI17_004659 [Phytophthora kernoviae]RLN84584.1 hypothetical protein BBO99_00001252 [Phytophthora kernoviae]
MPLVPRYTWEEDAFSIALELQLPGTALRNIDIYVSDLVVKVNAAPYVLLLDLQETVDDASAAVKSIPASNVLRISLQKQTEGLWKQLQYQDTKQALRERRDASMERKRASETVLSQKRKERKHQEEKATLRAQMAVDDTNRQILTDLKAEEKEREERSLYESFRDLQVQRQEKEQQKEKKQLQQVESNLSSEVKSLHKREGSSLLVGKSKKKVAFAALPHGSVGLPASVGNHEEEIIELTADGSFDISTASKLPVFEQQPSDKTSDNTLETELCMPMEGSRDEAIEVDDEFTEQEEVVELPPPRECIQSEIRFTPRAFPTPSRESKAAEEEDWLLKNRKHINKHKGLNRTSEYDISETDPMWLKAKGDDFFHAKDFRGATNAYGEAISATPDDNIDLITTCLSNRAACLLQLEEFEPSKTMLLVLS